MTIAPQPRRFADASPIAGVDRPNGFFQSAWVVSDLDQAMHDWLVAGVGPFYVVRHAKVQDFRYRGVPSTLNFSVGLAQSGPMQIELIMQHDDRPSHYRDSFACGESGFHHICRFVDDFAAELAKFETNGIVLAASGRAGDMRFGYLDTREALNCMTEIIEDRASMRDFFRTIAMASIDWDGRDPIRDVLP